MSNDDLASNRENLNEFDDQARGLARDRSRSRNKRSHDEAPFSPSPRNRSRSRDRRVASMEDLLDGSSDSLPESPWTKDKLPDPLPNEFEFIIANPRGFQQGKSITSHIKDLQGSFRFRLLVFPMGTVSTGRPEQLAAFVEVVPPEDCREVRWMFEHVRYLIAVINWKDYRKTMCQQDTFTFQRDNTDRGWHRGFLKAADMTTESGWLNDRGELCLRAACQARRAMSTMPSGPIGGMTSWRSVGYVGLKNHGATCYMNGLLQTLFHIGRFRHIVYSIDCPESVEQADGDDTLDAGDDRQALPLLVALQNLFYRLQTSDMVVSCRELMRSFGWDTADAFMQHDVQELNRLLCDRVEEQMKNTAMDGEIKRLFEGEMENYIECVDVDYRSTRVETFYDLQLNVRNDAGTDLTSLEESLRDFTSEETLEGDNAYDAGSFGKQRARKGIRFKRFPPVLHFQLKRFMFDVERCDMCKLNGRLEFPQVLDMEPFAPGSGKYTLHTVVVHSGGVSSGHYYAFVRVRDTENANAQWLKFDDEQVSLCSEHSAVDDNYGGEDLDLWNYFSMSPQDIQEQQPPTVARIHNAYMLSYVRADQAEQILKPPNLEEGAQCTPYHRMVERCVREARLVEERKRNKLEQLARIEVRLLLESDLQCLEGFWTYHDMCATRKLRMSRDQMGEDLYQEVAESLGKPQGDIALFLLNLRRSKQARFTWISPSQILRNHIPAQGAPHSTSCEPHFIVLCVTTTENLQAWGDDVRMLIVKYFCPQMQQIVCLGCYTTLCDNPLEGMLNDEQWFQKKLQPFIDKKQIMPPSTTKLLCWEEYCTKRSEDILERKLKSSIAAEQLQDGDILIWQPEPEEFRVNPSEVSCLVSINSTQLPIFPKTLLDCMSQKKLQEYARTVFSTLGKSKTKSSPPLHDDATRLSMWVQVALGHCFERIPGETCEDIEIHEDSYESEIELDLCNGDQALVVDKFQRGNDLFARMRGGDFPVSTVRERVNAAASQVVVMVRMYVASEVPCASDGMFTDSSPDTVQGAGEMKDLSVDMRWPVSTFMARIMETFDVNIEAFNLWLFERGAPTQVDDEPCFCTEDFSFDFLPPLWLDSVRESVCNRSYVSANRVMLDLLKTIYDSGQNGNGWLFHVAMIERPRNPKTERPVKIHFFNHHVQEVGTHIFYMPIDSQEDSCNMASEAGRPAFDPLQLLRSARNFLSKDEKLLAQMSPQGSGAMHADELPLRIVDVFSGRIRRFSCLPEVGIDSTERDGNHSELDSAMETTDNLQCQSLWPAFGHNFLAVPIRVEPNWECDDAGECIPCDPKLLVEVFHKEPHSSIATGHPCLLRVEDPCNLDVDKASDSLRDKLQVSDADMTKWQIKTCRTSDRSQKPCLCIERVTSLHRTRSRAESPVRSVRTQKPLTIRGGG